MAKCVNCGNWKLIQEHLLCIVCGKEGCSKCFSFLFEIIDQNNVPLDKWYACSDKCLDCVAKDIESQISPEDIPADSWDQIPPIHFLTERAVLNVSDSKRLKPNMIERLGKGRRMHVFFAQEFPPHPFQNTFGEKEDKAAIPNNPLWNKLFRHANMLKAQHFETLREYENAAKVYKSLGMYEEAGKVREKRDEIRVKRTEISVDLGSLLEQVKNGGIVAIYRCPHCGGKLKIDKNAKIDKLRVCEHCGSEIETVDLADFLKTALS
jgi:DNA-directed RNA polymerase subunit RPC12/RpoP